MANPSENTPATPSAKIEAAKLDLPSVESPSISPADLVSEPVAAAAPTVVEAIPAPAAEATATQAVEPTPAPIAETAATPAEKPAIVVTPAAWPSFPVGNFNARQKRHALLAASVAIAAGFGAVIGATASGAFLTAPPQTNVAAVGEQKAMEQSIARLNKEIAALKTNLDATAKSAHTQIAKITERADRIERNASAELVTGSISAPQTVPAAPVPTPVPRPAPRIAAAEVAPAPVRPQVVQDWAIREARDGYVYVQGHGDLFQVVPGAPLPGLGTVESIRRQDGRWVVTTPKGIIVSMRDRRYFE
jgi:hypothetical protein